MVKLSYDCFESIEHCIKIEHTYLSKVIKTCKDIKILEKMILMFKENLQYKKCLLYDFCEFYNLKMVKMLIEKCKVEVNPLHLTYACKRGSKKIVKYLLKNFDENKDHKPFSNISYAFKTDNYKIAKMVLKKFGDKIEISNEISYNNYKKNKKVFRLLVTTYKEKLPVDINLIIYMLQYQKDKKTLLKLMSNKKNFSKDISDYLKEIK